MHELLKSCGDRSVKGSEEELKLKVRSGEQRDRDNEGDASN